MADILLSKPKLPEGWIDTSVGEAHIVREALFKTFPILDGCLVHLKLEKKMEYPPPNGYGPLVKFLEDKYQAPSKIVVTNGAKQALGACFYALNKMGKTKLGMRNPYWALIPPLAHLHGLEIVEKYNSYLAILPNNPDGFMFDYEYAKFISDYHKDLKIPFIHDAVYYTPVYMPKSYNFGPLGDVQIYSLSKMYGLSGLRIGWIVCHNEDYYKLVSEYMETMTVGVSIASQDIALRVLQEVKNNEEKFINEARNKLHVAKALCKTINEEVLEVPKNITDIYGMFGWFGLGPKCDFNKARINTVNGKLFGDKDSVRLNLALPTNTLIEVIDRLNGLVK